MNDEKKLTFDIKIKGDDNKVIGSIEKQVNIHYDSSIHRQVLPLGFKASHELYSVLACNYSEDNVFQLSIKSENYCLNTDDSVYNLLGTIEEGGAEKIKSIPTILLRPSKKAKDDYALFGFVTGIERSADSLILNFFLLTKIPLDIIYGNMDALDIKNAKLNHGLEKEAYSFHEGNLFKMLSELGVIVPLVSEECL